MGARGKERTSEVRLLICNTHGESEHALHGKKSSRWKCLQCSTEYGLKYTHKRKLKCIEYKGGKCSVCDYSSFYGALDFFNKEPYEKCKDLRATGFRISWSRLKKILDQTELVCKNCQAEHEFFKKPEKKLRVINESKSYHRKLIHRMNARKLGITPKL